jgi:D-alanyl-D-alanine carboxypeptidase (penicillin-binding protein 5/6)
VRHAAYGGTLFSILLLFFIAVGFSHPAFSKTKSGAAQKAVAKPSHTATKAASADEEPDDASFDSGSEFIRFYPNGTPNIQGKMGILIDPRTKKVLWEKNAHLRRPMASLTKVMTTLLILESGRLDDTVIASKNANATQYSSMYLAVGEKVKLRDLLWAILLRSANDACVAAAEHLGGSVPAFVAKMNQRAQQLGLKDTHFVTPNGLHEPGHYSTAYDLAQITMEDMKYPLFNEMVKTKRHVIERSIRKQNAVMVSRSRILWRWPVADGVKTGYTKQAGHCFIGSATENGWRLLSVVMNSPKVGYDTQAVLEYGFKKFHSVKLAEKGQPLVSQKIPGSRDPKDAFGPGSDVYAVLPRKQAAVGIVAHKRLHPGVRAPLSLRSSAGSAVWEMGNEKLAEAALFPLKPVEEIPVMAAAKRSWMWPLAVVGLTFGALKYGASAKNNRKRRGGFSKRGGSVGRGR